MRVGPPVVCLMCAVSLYGQYNRGHHFSWQDSCFNNPRLPYCIGHESAVNHKGEKKNTAVSNGLNGTADAVAEPEYFTPSVVAVGAVDWRFADPSPDALVGFSGASLAASPLARSLIQQLGSGQGLAAADVDKTLDALSGVQHVAISVHDQEIVIMVAGRGTDTILPSTGAGWKVVPVVGNSLLAGHAEAVDRALHRIETQSPPADLTRAAQQIQSESDFWAVGSSKLLGPQFSAAGIKRFALSASMQDHLTTELAVELDAEPNARTPTIWPTSRGDVTVEGKEIHVRTSLEPGGAQQGCGELLASPLGQKLSALVQVTRYLPTPDTTVHTKPIIYGLDNGPTEATR